MARKRARKHAEPGPVEPTDPQLYLNNSPSRVGTATPSLR